MSLGLNTKKLSKIYKKWGDRAARISNHNMYSHKSAIDKQFETKDIENLYLEISN